MSAAYDTYMDCEASISSLIRKEKMVDDISSDVRMCYIDVSDYYRKIVTGFYTVAPAICLVPRGTYGWNGDDAEACAAKAGELYLSMRNTEKKLEEAFKAIKNAIIRKRQELERMQTSALAEFDEIDKLRMYLS